MYGKVQIGDKTVEMLSNAASPVFFKQVFHEDFAPLVEIASGCLFHIGNPLFLFILPYAFNRVKSFNTLRFRGGDDIIGTNQH